MRQPGNDDKVLVTRRDLELVLDFVIGWYPGYEDAISWGDYMSEADTSWMEPARRLKQEVGK